MYMDYHQIPDTMMLPLPYIKMAIFEETKELFNDRPHVLSKWQSVAYNERTILNEEQSLSFHALYKLITNGFFPTETLNKSMIKQVVQNYEKIIHTMLHNYIIQEFPHEEVNKSMNQETIENVQENQYLLMNMDVELNLLRDIVSKNKPFTSDDSGLLSTEIIDNKGNIRGLAEIRPADHQVPSLTTDQEKLWINLIESTLSSLDEMTADLFDLITYLWMSSPKNSDGYIEFHSNDALQLRNIKARSTSKDELDYREEDRFNIMKRVAALSSIWVSLNDEQIKVVDMQNLDNKDLYTFKDFQRMFEVGKMRVAYDKRSGEPKGIYALEIRPSSILTPYLEREKPSIGLLDLKVFQYNHYTQRLHKRMIRYLSYQWKIRITKKNLQQPFKILTLLNILDISPRYNGVQKRDLFESVLDDLQRDQIIGSWTYTETIDEDRIGKTNWFKGYWSKLQVRILPTEELLQNNRNITAFASKLREKSIIEHFHQMNTNGNTSELATQETAVTTESTPIVKPKVQSKPLNFEQQQMQFLEEIVLTPDSVRKAMKDCNLSIRQSAEEIGISHTTLSRYLRGEIKKQNKKNDEKIHKWLQDKSSMNAK